MWGSCGYKFSKSPQFSKLKLTSAALTHAIRAKAVGCTGKSMRIDGSSSTCVHISRWKIPQRLLDILDKKGADDEAPSNQNEAGQEMAEINESEVEILATASSSAGADDETLLYQNEAIQETVEIYDSEVKILEAASSSAASSSAEAEYMRPKGKRRNREMDSLKDSLTPREVIPKRRPRKEVTYK